MHVGEDSREADAHVNEDGGSESKSYGEDASLLPENGLDGMSLTAERKAAMVDCLFSAQKLLESSSLAEDAASIALAHLREPRRLYRFLCVSDFDPTAAAQMLVDYAGYCANGLRPASAEAAAVILSAGLVEVIPERDLEGRAVLLVRDVRVLGELLQTHTLEEVAAAHLWLLEERVLVDDVIQECGVSIVQDLSELSFRLMLQLSQPSTLLCQLRFARFLTTAFPCKWGHLVVVDAPSSISMVWPALRSVFPTSLAESVKFLCRPESAAELHKLLGFHVLA